MNYDQHTFAIQSAYYLSHSKRLSQQTILTSIHMFENAINFVFDTIEQKFNSRKLFVLFEEQLNCEVSTDHLIAKNIYPIYKDFMNESKKNLLSIQNSQVIYNLEKTFYELVQSELQLRLETEFRLNQEQAKAKTYFSQLNSLTETNKVLLSQLAEMKSLYAKFEQMTKEQFNLKLKTGKMYRPDFWDVNMLDRNSQVSSSLNSNQDALIAQLRRQILQLQNEKDELQRKLDYYLSQMAEIPNLQRLIQQLKDEIERLLAIIADFKGQNSTLTSQMQQQIDQLQMENQRLKDELDRLKSIEDDYWKLKALYDALMKKYNDDMDELRRQIASLLAQVDMLQSENDRLNAENRALMNENQKLKDENEKLQRINDQLMRDNEMLREELVINSKNSNSSKNLQRGMKLDDLNEINKLKSKIKERLDPDSELGLLAQLVDHCRKYQKVIQTLTGLEVSLEDAQTRQVMRKMIPEDGNFDEVEISIQKLKIPSQIVKKAVYLYKNKPEYKHNGQQCQIIFVGGPHIITNDQLHNRNQSGVNPIDETFKKPNHSFRPNSSVLSSLTNFSPSNKNQLNNSKLLNDLDHAQDLIEQARQHALRSLDDNQDAAVQTTGVEFYEGDRKARASRAFGIAKKYLKMSEFTLKYTERLDDWEIPEVFKRLYNAAAEIREKRQLLASQIHDQESKIVDRTAQKISQSGLSIDNKLSGLSMLKVEKGNNSNKRSQLVYDLPASGSRIHNSGVFGNKTFATGNLRDTELMEALFNSTNIIKEKTFPIQLKDSK